MHVKRIFKIEFKELTYPTPLPFRAFFNQTQNVRKEHDAGAEGRGRNTLTSLVSFGMFSL